MSFFKTEVTMNEDGTFDHLLVKPSENLFLVWRKSLRYNIEIPPCKNARIVTIEKHYPMWNKTEYYLDYAITINSMDELHQFMNNELKEDGDRCSFLFYKTWMGYNEIEIIDQPEEEED